ncbi:transglutaminase domain-containing protein [Tenacibaculum sp. M341]|uniref:transglutaminase domain-containing protein n=1 Tax=Tenacibaculum sp. M341 TaxID=2530339 RepID=UPI0014049356|nr:transglutaminase domain-containing protein [Tenacibaculum sp. M341]
MHRFILVFFLFTLHSFSQDFSSVKEKVNAYKGISTSEKLALQLKKDFKSNENKIKALYYWLTNNIRYDLEEFYNPNREKVTVFRYQTLEERERKIKAMNDKIIKETLLRRRAVCEGYARTFADVCTLLNIENEVITGYVRASINYINKPLEQPNHAWNAVKLNNKWIYIDATWGAGFEFNGKWLKKFNPYFYNIPNKKYFKTHLPEKSVWRLRVGNIDKQKFYEQPILSNDFLSTNIELSENIKGVLRKDSNNKIQFNLKNIESEEIFIGFLGISTAFTPAIEPIKNNEISVSIEVPDNVRECFLLINRQVAVQFLVE